jgi:hypothetical protein
MSTPAPEIEREAGKVTIHPVLRDFRRKLVVDFAVAIESLPQPGTYRASFPAGDSAGEVPADFTRVAPTFPVPQILHDGDTLRLELYRERPTGPSLAGYIHVGPLNSITPRNEAPHDTYADDAEFNLSRAQVQVDGVTQASAAAPEILRGAVAWVYVPGHGRYVLSFKPSADADNVGEVTGNSLTFTEGRNIFRIECADRIASGSGSYRVHVFKEAEWLPAELTDRQVAMFGATPELR